MVKMKFYALHQGIAEFVILAWEWLDYLISHFYFFLNLGVY